MKNRIISLFLILVMLLSLCGAALARENAPEEEERVLYSSDKIYTVDYDGVFPDPENAHLGAELGGTAPGDSLGGTGEEAVVIVTEGEEGSASGSSFLSGAFLPQEGLIQEDGEEGSPVPVRQLTIEDIQAMNPDSLVIDLYSDQGYLTMLVGKYYDGQVNDMEDGILSIQGVAALLGLNRGSEFFAVSKTRHRNTGYTVYTYQQRYGDVTLRYATLRVIVDPEGYTAGLSCSFVPNAGTASKEPLINADQALAIVKARYASQNLVFYPESTFRAAVPIMNKFYNCYVVYTSNPSSSAAFDMPYLEHYVSTDGEYVTAIPASAFAHGTLDIMDNSGYFEGLEVQRYSTTLKLEDGTTRTVDVPVSYNPNDGLYYLIDPERKIAVAQYYDFNYLNYKVNLVTSKTIDGWSRNNLLAYANYGIVYDFYADHGIRSVDGYGTPILITVGWCDENGKAVDNACFYGVNMGWACFGVSDINNYCEAVDVVGHEYTHGIVRESLQGIYSLNETGAISEAYSDILGNLAEMSLNYTEDRAWKVGEKTGAYLRCMSDPNLGEQPEYVGDRYYKSPVLNPDFDINDSGGIHSNNSLLGHIAYLMDQAGMSYEEQISVWLVAILPLTPMVSYQEMHGALLLSLKINGLLQQYGGVVNRAFEAVGLDEDWTESYLKATRAGCGRVIFEADEEMADILGGVVILNTAGDIVDIAYPDPNGVFSTLLPAGDYMATLMRFSDTYEREILYYNGSGWSRDKQVIFTVGDGEVLELPTHPKESQSEDLNLFTFNGGYFSMLMPDGWRIEVNGEYSAFSVKIFDPDDPSTQMFYYGALAPYFRSEASRQFWAATYPILGAGPVLNSEDILGVLNAWEGAIQAQKAIDGKQLFTSLKNRKFVGGSFYESGIGQALNPVESGCVITCATDWDSDCRLTVLCSLVDLDVSRMYGGKMFLECDNLYGILAPASRYDQVFDTLLECLQSLQFSPDYIRASQSTQAPMADQRTLTAAFVTLSKILRAIYVQYGK